jgi:hypothetical protein
MVTRKRALLAAAAVLVLAGVAGAIVVDRWAPRPSEQPIAFPHDVHAGDNQIPCMYCHTAADRSRSAGIPSVQVCAGCHIPGGQPLIGADRPEVRKLIAYWQQQRPIPWVRIYDLPDHAHFPHNRHVNAGLQCQQCHGPVETMNVITQYSSLQMGWCIDCHRERGARTDCFVCHY